MGKQSDLDDEDDLGILISNIIALEYLVMGTLHLTLTHLRLPGLRVASLGRYR